MRFLVFSDSHGISSSIENAFSANDNINAVFFLGDGIRDIEHISPSFGNIPLYCVRGNCDLACDEPLSRLEILCSKRIFFTHGHEYGVKYGTERLLKEGIRLNADIILYGHTHQSVSYYSDGIYVFNPGSAAQGRYGLIEIRNNGILLNEMRLY